MARFIEMNRVKRESRGYNESYAYTREIVDGAYNIDNIALIGPDGFIIRLAKVCQEQFPTKGKVFLEAMETDVVISFEIPLDAAEKTALDTLVANYKNGILP